MRVGGDIHGGVAKHLWRAQHAAPLRLIGAIDMNVGQRGHPGTRGASSKAKSRRDALRECAQDKPALRNAGRCQYWKHREAPAPDTAYCAPTEEEYKVQI
jgi:hypothetical protein